jgi:uncharacterized protein YifN (PemK superfamily)
VFKICQTLCVIKLNILFNGKLQAQKNLPKQVGGCADIIRHGGFMAIQFAPKKGMILMCNFAGYKLPEIIKIRPVVVISPNHLRRGNLVTVVPFSTTPPSKVMNHHCSMPNHILKDGSEVWAKCDMLATVGWERLDRVKTGKRHYETLYVSEQELTEIMKGVACSLGIDI